MYIVKSVWGGRGEAREGEGIWAGGGYVGEREYSRVWYAHTRSLCPVAEVSLASGSAEPSQVDERGTQGVDCKDHEQFWDQWYLHGVADEEGAA